MSILDLHADVTSAALPRYVKPPQLTPTPTFSAWKLATSPIRGAGEAVAQVGASIAEVVAGYGDVMGRIEAGQSLQDRQPDMQSDFGDALRDRGREFRPDPLTAHSAEQVLYGFARGATKVVGGTAVAGPLGAVGAGVEEGISAADDLAREGVDFETRVKAASVQGIGLALAALPLVGKTMPQTAALYLAGGPGGFVAQQALTREILRAGGYEGIAEQYDPLDPVGLTVSALIPAAFTAAGIRAQRAARRVPVDVEDAARVALQAEQRRSTNPETGPRAADQHEAALVKAEDAMARGDAVQVSFPRVDIRNETDAGPSGQTNGVLRMLIDEREVGSLDYTVFDGVPQISMIEVPQAMRRRGIGGELVRELQRHFPGQPLDWGMMTEDGAALRRSLAKEVITREDVVATQRDLDAAVSERTELEAKMAEFERIVDPTEAQRSELREWIAKVGDRWNDLHDRIEALHDKLASSPAATYEIIDTSSPLANFGAKLEAGAKALQKAAGPDAPAIVTRLIGEPAPARAAAPDAVQPGEVEAPNVPPESPATAATEAAASPAAAAETTAATSRIAQIEAQFPDLMVRMDGDEKARPLSEFLAAAKAEADEMAADAPLMQVAAECALLNGS